MSDKTMNRQFFVIIPARYNSTRLPGKPLAEISGLPMIIRVANNAVKSGAKSVTVATDDQRIESVVNQYNYRCMMTKTSHQSGTDRVVEASKHLGLSDDAIVVNVQGDEPEIEPKLISELAKHLSDNPEVEVATACKKINSYKDFIDRNIVKAVLDKNKHALYFSRAPIPWARDEFSINDGMIPEGLPVFHHIGIYAYRNSFLKRYEKLNKPKIEIYEKLEQLRIIWNGYSIACLITSRKIGQGIDTIKDLEEINRKNIK